MDNTIIIILALILLVLIILNHITITTTIIQPGQANCSQTAYGCCPDGVNSKINFNGTNCPGYNPSPYPAPIGGCAGTRFGCCPNSNKPKIDQQGSNCYKN